MRVVLAAHDTDEADWLARVLGEAGVSVSVLDDVSASSPELRGADLVILDNKAAKHLGEAGPDKRVLVVGRGSTVDLDAVRGKFADVLALPAPPDEVVARIRHALEN